MLFVLMIGLMSCGGGENTAETKSPQKDRVEVIYFHGKQRCLSCRAIERFARETVDSCYSGNKDVAFKTVDITTLEGANLADEYRIYGSALLIIKNEQGKSTYEDMTAFAFRNARKHTPVFKKEIDNKIKEFLK